MPRANREAGERPSEHDRAPSHKLNPLSDSPTGRLAEARIEGPRRGWAYASRITPAPPSPRCFLRERGSPRVARTALGPRSQAAPHPGGRAPPGAEGASGLARRSLMPRPVGIMQLGQHSKPAVGRSLRLAPAGQEHPGPHSGARPGTLTGDV